MLKNFSGLSKKSLDLPLMMYNILIVALKNCAVAHYGRGGGGALEVFLRLQDLPFFPTTNITALRITISVLLDPAKCVCLSG